MPNRRTIEGIVAVLVACCGIRLHAGYTLAQGASGRVESALLRGRAQAERWTKMAMVPCPWCKKNVSDDTATCPNCGQQLNKVLRGSDWQRREEEVAKMRQTLNLPHLWDFGVGQHFKALLPSEIHPEQAQAFIAEVFENVPDGLHIVYLGEIPVYVEKDTKKHKGEIGLRADFVAWRGEEEVAWIDAQILGTK